MKINTRVRTLDGEMGTVISAARYRAQTRSEPPAYMPGKLDPNGQRDCVRVVLVWLDNTTTPIPVADYQVMVDMVPVKKAFGEAALRGL